METFKITGDYIQLIQLLKVTGLCMSGGEAKICVEDGMVSLNGKVELQKRKKIRAGDIVEFEGELVKVE